MIEEWQIEHNEQFFTSTTKRCFRWLVDASFFLGGLSKGQRDGYAWMNRPDEDIYFRFYTGYGVTKIELNSKSLMTGLTVGGVDPFAFNFLSRDEGYKLLPSTILKTATAVIGLIHEFFPRSLLTSAIAPCFGCAQLSKPHRCFTYGNFMLESDGPALNICTPIGDKWLCDKCQDMFALPAPSVEEADNAKKVYPERAKMTVTLRFDVLARDRFACKTCGRSPLTDDSVKLHVDHIYPVSLGGKTEMDNLQALCDLCNLGKSNKVVEQLTLGI